VPKNQVKILIISRVFEKKTGGRRAENISPQSE